MPRDGSNVYHIPLGTEGVPDTTIESAKYNAFAHDIERDLNTPRPIISGGSGATSPDGALVNLSAEKAGQFVTNFDSHAWMAGSFYSDITATAAPVAGHAFAGIAYISSPAVMVVEARDMTDPGNPMYVRVKTAGVWGAWITDNASQYVKKSGDTMTGLLTLSGDPVLPLHASTKQYTDATVVVGTVAPVGRDASLWWESDGGVLYLKYNDGDSSQWVAVAGPPADIASFLHVSGDTMVGPLILHGDPTVPLGAATKQYVDAHEVRAGTIRFTLCTTPEVGWLFFDDGTIGDATSGASHANADSVNLFTVMFDGFSDANAPILTSAGAATTRGAQGNAAAAWAAHARISLPKALGRAFGVAGAAGTGLTARALGAAVGAETHVLTVAELALHSHAFTGNALPAHDHDYNTFQGQNQTGAGPNPPGGNQLGSTTGGKSAGTPSGTNANAGTNTPHNNMSPYVFLNAEVKL